MLGLTIFVVVILVNNGLAQGPDRFAGSAGSRDRRPDGFRRGGDGGARPPAPVRDCPRDRQIEQFTCGGRGNDVIDCPASSECVTERTTRAQICCWNDMSTVSAPCEDPMMRGNEFVTCTSTASCPGSCHNCQSLQGVGTGLCCPQVNRQGCERSSPMRNEFEASRRRIQGMGDGGGSSTSGGGGGTSGDQFGPMPDRSGGAGMDRGGFGGRDPAPSVGMDFGMTRDTGAGAGTPRRMCPGGGMSVGQCAQGYPCGEGQVCMAVTRTSGICCSTRRATPTAMPGPGVRPPFAPGMMGRGMMMQGFRGGFPSRRPIGFGGFRPPFMGMGRRPGF